MRQCNMRCIFMSKSLKWRSFRVWMLGTCSLAAQALIPGAMAADPAPAPPATSVVSPDYLIGPGDTLQVFVWRNPDLTVTVPVRPDGKISTPLVEDMVAVGKTPSQLARDIETSLSKYVKSPKVNVVVMVALSIYSQVKVIGQVKEPQALVRTFSIRSPAPRGRPAIMPAKISRLMPLPMPRSVICSPSHMMKAVPVVRVIMVMRMKPGPGFNT